MAFMLDQIVPWGRSFDEYVRMFGLTNSDLGKKILGCGDGPTSFNATMHKRGKSVVSVDPLYRFSAAEIQQRIHQIYPTMIQQLVANQAAYVWTTIRSPDDLGRIRMAVMTEFLADFEQGRQAGRYLPHELPDLPFGSGEFKLALCSHFLFTYSDQLSADFHCRAVLEMCRVADEVRIFPLLDQGGEPSSHVEPVCDAVQTQGFQTAVQTVDYEFQRGGNRMLRIKTGTTDGTPGP